MKHLIAEGAEAKIYRDGSILKSRVVKGYRIPEIDDRLRKSRTRREAKVLETLQKKVIPAPKLIKMDDKAMDIEMELIEGPKLRDILDNKNCLAFGKEMGELIAKLHNEGIIHGDLTTSNMIFRDRIHLIDFGLSFFSQKVEDKAVDLHLLRQALESKHYKLFEKCFDEVLKSYLLEAKDAKAVLERLSVVEERGRNKQK